MNSGLFQRRSMFVVPQVVVMAFQVAKVNKHHM